MSAWVASQVAVSALSFRFWGWLITTVPEALQQDLLTSITITESGKTRVMPSPYWPPSLEYLGWRRPL